MYSNIHRRTYLIAGNSYTERRDDSARISAVKLLSFTYQSIGGEIFMEEEIWKPIVYKDIRRDMYEISNLGRVRNKITGHIMSLCPSEKGYMMALFMCEKSSKRRHASIKIHRLVALNFVDGRDETHNEVDHKDCDKRNNKASNLEWVTRLENIHRGYENGLIPIKHGNEIWNAKYSEDLIHYICKLLLWYNGNCDKVYKSFDQEKISIPRRIIHDVKYKKSWLHVSDGYFTKHYFRKR